MRRRTNMEETLQGVMDIQLRTQVVLYPKLKGMTQEQMFLENTRAMVHEVIETENEVNWKHWKLPVPVDEDKLKGEIADQFIFLINQCNIAGMDANELLGLTLDKININIDRQSNGY